ncbi:MAG: hypothetical protein ACXVIO_04650 [Candidatus Angelobacter sp.]
MARRSPQPPASLVIILAIAAFLVLRYFRKPPPPTFTCGVHCGTERWRIKTIFDNDAKRINFMPRHTSISELVAMRAPQILSDERSDAEKQVYSVEAVLLGWKQETAQHGDHDFHMVLADPNDVTRTMIAEVPSAECQGACSSSQTQHFAEVRQILTAQLSEPEAHFRRFPHAWVVRVEGVGFFDVFHQQIGVAENCMELHPLLKVEFVRQLSPAFPLPHRIEAPADHHCGHLDREGRFADEE